MRSALGSDPTVDPIYIVEVVNEFPHDPNAFTQVCYFFSISLFIFNWWNDPFL